MTPPRQRLEEKQGKRSLSLSADELCFDTRTCLGVHHMNLNSGELFASSQ